MSPEPVPVGQDFLARLVTDRRRRVAAMREIAPPHVLRARLGRIEPAGRLERALRRGGPAGPLRWPSLVIGLVAFGRLQGRLAEEL